MGIIMLLSSFLLSFVLPSLSLTFDEQGTSTT